MKSEDSSSAGKASTTGAQSGRWVSIILENAWIECNGSVAFLTLVSASGCVAACPYLQWTLAIGLF